MFLEAPWIINSEVEIAARVIRQSWKVHAEVATPSNLGKGPLLQSHTLEGPGNQKTTNNKFGKNHMGTSVTQDPVLSDDTEQFTIQHACCCESRHLSTRGTLCHPTLCPNEEERTVALLMSETDNASEHEEHLSGRNYQARKYLAQCIFLLKFHDHGRFLNSKIGHKAECSLS